MEEEIDEVTSENENNSMTETSAPQTIPTPMMKPIPAASVGVDGITTVSINASVPPATVMHPYHEVKKGKDFHI